MTALLSVCLILPTLKTLCFKNCSYSKTLRNFMLKMKPTVQRCDQNCVVSF